jgi:hypothetical protein
MKPLCFTIASICLIGCPAKLKAQQYRVISIANTVDVEYAGYYKHLTSYLNSIDSPYSIVVNGDITSSDNSSNVAMLLETLARSQADKIVIIPGDRDWDDSGKSGWQKVIDLEKEIKSAGKISNIIWPLDKACPGPELIELGPSLSLVVINTQWFNHPYDKPRQESGICTIATEGDFMEELEDIIDEQAGKNIIIGGHYPLISLGEYGGFHPLSKWFLPVPIVSGMITSFKQNVGSSTDLINENFHDFRVKLGLLLAKHSSLIYLSGHEKNLQVLEWNENYLINSGSPERSRFTANTKLSLFSEALPGLIELNYSLDGSVQTEIFKFDHASGFTSFNQINLMHSACNDVSKKRINTAFVPCVDSDKEEVKSGSAQRGYGEVAGGVEYEASGFKQAFMGAHYRDSWTAKVRVPYLELNSTFGGLTPFAKGGGRQTKSLKFKAGNGYEYVFRSVNKDPAGALPEELRGTFVATVLRDQTTTQHPYGAMVADILLNELGILHAHPKLYLMPNDPILKNFGSDFGDMLGMLEERPTNPDTDNEQTFANAQKISKSFKMFKDLYNDKDNHVNQLEFARARAFDILVGDWGKHEDNWKWAGFESERFDGMVYRPIPRDRDHVFSRWDGLLPWLADREWAKASGENFNYKIKGLRSLMWQARHLDRFIANEMTREDWLQAAMFVQENIDDEVIEAAVKNMPEEMYPISGQEIEGKLKTRLKDLPNYTEKYYSMLAKQVDVVGSSKKEFFEVNRNADGSLKVAVYNVNGDKKGKKKFYEREFYSNETEEVRLFGLQGDDIFGLSGGGKGHPDIRMVGGYGDDIYNDESNGKVKSDRIFVYDNTGENEMNLSPNAKIKRNSDPTAYRYNRTSFAYNTYFPRVLLFYNADEGFQIGLSGSFTNHRFGKPDFSTKHDLNAEFTTQGNFIAGYKGRFHHVAGNWDLLVGARAGQPNKFNYFYGIGNETVKDESLFNMGFYRTRYNSYSAGFGFLNQFWKRSIFEVNFQTEVNSEQLEDDNIFILGSENYLGSDALDIFRSDLSLDLDFRDRDNLATRGMRFYLNHEIGWVLNQDEKLYHKLQSSIEQFVSTRNRGPLTLGIRFGGSYTSGDIPYYHRYFLGQNQNLRGYRKNRFTGDGSLFLNTDLRWKLGEFRTSIVPLGYGLRGFYDTGRVFLDGEDSNTWHYGYGFGFFVVPLMESLSFNLSLAFSEEESALVLFSIGKTFN